MNQHLRFKCFDAKTREIAILTVAREMDSRFEWAAHEPEALKEGVSQDIIDVIKHRKSTQGLDETYAAIIEFGRQIFRDHKVTSEAFARDESQFSLRTSWSSSCCSWAITPPPRRCCAPSICRCRRASRCCRWDNFPHLTAPCRLSLPEREGSKDHRFRLSNPSSPQRSFTASISFCSGQTLGGKRAPPRSGSGS